MAQLSSAEQKFILHWGEMGARWGVNRTIAQIHALLYLAREPVTAEQIANTLSVARSNVSTSLKALHGWGLVNVVHVLGDRRDHFESTQDVWELFKVVLEGRKQREVDPTLAVLRGCLEEAAKDGTAGEYTRERIEEMLELLESIVEIYDQIREMPRDQLEKLVRMGGKIQKLLAFLG